MVRFMRIAAVAGGALILSALPVLAQQSVNPLGLDLDPFHVFTPVAPPPTPPEPVVPVVEPAAPVYHHHWHHHHHHVVHHHHVH